MSVSVTLHLDTAVVRLANPSLTTEDTPPTDVSTVQAEGEAKYQYHQQRNLLPIPWNRALYY